MVRTGWESPLALEAFELPVPGPSQALVRVDACGVCHRDLLDREGRFPFIQVPITPGHEASGTVVAVGPGARDFEPGSRVGTMQRDACGACARCAAGQTSLCGAAAWVLGLLADGGYATHLLAPESALYPLPGDLRAPEAAVLQCTFGTAYRDLKTLGGLTRGERVLVTGANGGVGGAAVQVARRLGAEVTAIVREEAQRAYVERLGAHRVIVDAGGSFHGAAGGVDLALDTVGQPTFNSALRALRVGGRIVIVGNVVQEKASVNLGYVITNGLTIIGGSGAVRRDMAELLALHEAEPLLVSIDRTLPLSRADEAQKLVKRGGLSGRIVLVPEDPGQAISR